MRHHVRRSAGKRKRRRGKLLVVDVGSVDMNPAVVTDIARSLEAGKSFSSQAKSSSNPRAPSATRVHMTTVGCRCDAAARQASMARDRRRTASAGGRLRRINLSVPSPVASFWPSAAHSSSKAISSSVMLRRMSAGNMAGSENATGPSRLPTRDDEDTSALSSGWRPSSTVRPTAPLPSDLGVISCPFHIPGAIAPPPLCDVTSSNNPPTALSLRPTRQ